MIARRTTPCVALLLASLLCAPGCVTLSRPSPYDGTPAADSAAALSSSAPLSSATMPASLFAAPAHPRPHPYLYFTAAEVPALREKFTKEPFTSRWKILIANADLAMSGNASDPRAGGTRPVLGRVGLTAFVYAMTGERKYGEYAIAQAQTLLQADLWNRGWASADLGTAENSASCALAYDWCYDLMTPEQRSDFRERLLTLSTRLYLRSVRKGTAPVYDNPEFWVNSVITNWAGVVHGGCGLAALAMADESPEAREAAEYARSHVRAFLTGTTHEDGGGDEGVMYWLYGNEFSEYFASAAARFYGTDDGLYADLTRKATGYWNVYMQGPDGRFANFNDMEEFTCAGLYSKDGSFEGGPESSLSALFESKVTGGDKLLLWAADNGGANFYWRGASPFWFLWRRETTAAQGDRPRNADAILFRGNGHALLQSPSLWLAYSGGWTSDQSHANMDLGSFILCVNSERLVNDPGYGIIETGQHSTILVNGHGQSKGVRGKYLAFSSGQKYHYLSSDLSACYGEALTHFTRQIVMVDGRFLVFVDSLAAPGMPEFEWRLQTRSKIAVAEDGKSASVAGAKSGLQVLAVAPGDAHVTANTPAAAEPAPGRRRRAAPLSFVRIVPTAKAPDTVMITVLCPTATVPADAGDAAAASAAAPRATFDPKTLTLTVTDAGGKTDIIRFVRVGSDLVPKAVDGETVRPSLPKERTFQTYRKK